MAINEKALEKLIETQREKVKTSSTKKEKDFNEKICSCLEELKFLRKEVKNFKKDDKLKKEVNELRKIVGSSSKNKK